MEFFLQFLRIKRLRGYQGYGGYNGLQSQGYKVTGLQTVLNVSILEWKGYKVTKVTEDTHMFFSKIKLFL